MMERTSVRKWKFNDDGDDTIPSRPSSVQFDAHERSLASRSILTVSILIRKSRKTTYLRVPIRIKHDNMRRLRKINPKSTSLGRYQVNLVRYTTTQRQLTPPILSFSFRDLRDFSCWNYNTDRLSLT